MKQIIILIIIACLVKYSYSEPKLSFRQEKDFNFDWKFILVNDTTLPKKIPLNDCDWRSIRLPHDWSVEMPFDSTLEGCTGYLPGGVGIYQKHFKTDVHSDERNTFILFDGVYNNAKYWLNGKYLGENPYGYSPVYFDLTNILKADGSDNILTVHVDHSRYADSRWYTGSGIYRNVKLITTNKLYIPVWGTFITTPEVSEKNAGVKLVINVNNEFDTQKLFTLTTKIIDSKGNIVAEQNTDLKIDAGSESKYIQNFRITNPQLWDCENPNMYKAITLITKDRKIVDEYITPFGVRNIDFKVHEGFFLNGKRTLIKGVCLHYDGGLVGAAVPEGVWRRRLETLKEAGVNGIRTAHNPFSEEFLNLCDEMGFLVQDELFDELDYAKDKRLNGYERHNDYITRGYNEHFHKWAKSDLIRTLLRDRNHPSIIEWSIGNEIEWTYLNYRYITGYYNDPNDPEKNTGFLENLPMYSPEELKKRYDEWSKSKYVLAETAKHLTGWIKEFDTTRPTTANLIIPSVSMVSGFASAIDIAGYSYRNIIIPWAHKYFPDKQVTINECPGTWNDWKQVLEFPGVYGMYMWTGIDYIGERNNCWPQKSAWGDMLDLAGFKVQGWNYFKSVWKSEPHISIGTLPMSKSGFEVDKLSGLAVAINSNSYIWRPSNMHWNYEKGEPVLVEVCSNYSTVELFLNGKSLGYRSMSESPDRLMRWVIPFEPGILTAEAGFDGHEIVANLQTTSKPVSFTLTSDRSSLKADAYDVAHLVVQLIDENSSPVKTENTKVEFEIEGPVRLLGVDNGAWTNTQNFQSNHLVTDKGRCLAIIQSKKQKGKIKITAKADGFKDQSVIINVN